MKAADLALIPAPHMAPGAVPGVTPRSQDQESGQSTAGCDPKAKGKIFLKNGKTYLDTRFLLFKPKSKLILNQGAPLGPGH